LSQYDNSPVHRRDRHQAQKLQLFLAVNLVAACSGSSAVTASILTFWLERLLSLQHVEAAIQARGMPEAAARGAP
jgi:hypothetical protein